MPIYEYQCPKCSKVYEFIHKIGEDFNTKDSCIVVCDVCLEKLNKIVSAPGFRLLGEGFYNGKPQIDWD